MNHLNLIIDRPRYCGKERNCAVDIILDALPATVKSAMTKYIPDLIYRHQLSYDQASGIMHELLSCLNGYPVKAVVTDNTQREASIYSF